MNTETTESVIEVNENSLVTLMFRGQLVRTAGETWCVKDACDILGLNNNRQAITRLDPSDLTSLVVTSGGQRREMLFVNESGLYQLIFQSRKPEAREFRRWVTRVVLPQIRRQGFYVAHGMDPRLVRVRQGRALMAKAAQLRAEAEAIEEEARPLMTFSGAATVREVLRDCQSRLIPLQAASKCSRAAKRDGVPVGRNARGTSTYPREWILATLELNQLTMLEESEAAR